MSFLNRFARERFIYRLATYAVVPIAIEISVFEIYILTGGGYSVWFFVLENLNVFLFPRFYSWGNWATWGVLGMFLFVTLVGDIICKLVTARARYMGRMLH